MRFKERIDKTGACSEAVEWINGRDMKRAYAECERADWMLCLFGRMAGQPGWPTRQETMLAVCDCAETSLKYFTEKYPDDDRPTKAIATAREWARGKATDAELQRARDAAWVARADAWAARDAAGAAWDAGDAAGAARDAAWADAHKRMCEMTRKRLPCPKQWGRE